MEKNSSLPLNSMVEDRHLQDRNLYRLLYSTKMLIVYKLYGFLYRKIVRYLYSDLIDIYIERIKLGVMRMTYTTKMRKNAGSMITVIPSPLINLLGLESGDSMRWEIEIEGNKALINVIPEKQKQDSE